jgi:hypothetical protein
LRVFLLIVLGLVVAAAFALLPFKDHEVPCGPPLLGAEPGDDYSIVPGTCESEADDRLRVAALGLGFASGCVATALITRVPRRRSHMSRDDQRAVSAPSGPAGGS